MSCPQENHSGWRAGGQNSSIYIPPVCPPKPTSTLQQELDRMERVTQDLARLVKIGFSPKRGGSPAPSDSSAESIQTQVLACNQVQNNSHGLVDGPVLGSGVTVSQLSAFLQRRLAEHQSHIKNAPGIATNIQTLLIDECRIISQDYNKEQRLLQQRFDQIYNENVHVKTQLGNAQRELADHHNRSKADISDGNEPKEERDTVSLQSQVNELLHEAQKHEKEWLNILEQSRVANEALLKRIKVQEEQLNGKRALWVESNPRSSAHRGAMTTINNSLATPSTSRGASVSSGHWQMSTMANSPTPGLLTTASGNGSFGKGSFGKHSRSKCPWAAPHQAAAPNNPANIGPRRRPHPSPGRRNQSEALNVSGPEQLAHTLLHVPNTEHGVAPLNLHRSQALMPYNINDDEMAEEYAAALINFYRLVEGWAKTYTSTPNLANDRGIASSNVSLWAFMMDCTYPGFRQDSHTHVMTLLGDPNTRYWFVMRMCLTVCVNEIIDLRSFYGYSEVMDREIDKLMVKLQERGGQDNDGRQKLINQRARIVQHIISAPDYQRFRSDQLTVYSKRFRQVLGPMLDDSIHLGEAGRDVGVIVTATWELAAKLYSAPLTFQIKFPPTASRFSTANMIAKNRPYQDALQLQISQARLKLVITPIATLRDDRNTTIKAKNLHRSLVLTMD
ncbi:uncharacterized protein BP5553_04062 [Venustampulla echinocandica]|uniref:Uncharacterized protein n=1 Tax=Venustampulla echinocandica TaxID=2656787 RepID=A0A370TW25_9HELO|nr:uncharacterized protein BP5553_04062 [Venustampulla echinocandica]RDL39722.1 hypothetical protein BP5553_04062 [Venustampulla echinocandica]